MPILKGSVQITVAYKRGNEGVIKQLGEGDLFDDWCVASQELYLASANTTIPSIAIDVELDIQDIEARFLTGRVGYKVKSSRHFQVIGNINVRQFFNLQVRFENKFICRPCGAFNA